MRKIAIIGGKLQGLEAVYLASKAGMDITLIDKNQKVPAGKLCHHFVCQNILERKPELIAELKKADFVLPALENEEVLSVLNELAKTYGFKLAFDLDAYLISSSKLASDALMQAHRIPAPLYYPNCQGPYIVKPSGESGSAGVSYMKDTKTLETFLKSIPKEEKWIAQEFLAGKSYSIEIIGKPGNYRTYEITELFMDDVYDCMRVCAPCDIGQMLRDNFSQIALRLAELVSLSGIMDVEVILSGGVLKVLEIDARLPSQTPTVVYHASGYNLIEELADLFCGGDFTAKPLKQQKKMEVSFEHLLIADGQISGHGEHIIASAGPLSLLTDFCGADEVLTDYQPGAKTFIGTFIITAKDKAELEIKRERLFEALKRLANE